MRQRLAALLLVSCILLASCGVASAQLVTVQGTIELATGALPSGTATITNQYFVTNTGQVVPAGTIVTPITNGVVHVCRCTRTSAVFRLASAIR